jgi:hypothetical protein
MARLWGKLAAFGFVAQADQQGHIRADRSGNAENERQALMFGHFEQGEGEEE